jgi:LytS/YehU family sensor histidine kinase
VAIGAPPLTVYASGILTGSALGALGDWLVHEALRRTPSAIPGLRTDAIGAQSVFVFFEYLIWGSIVVWTYVNRRDELRAKARMNASRLQHARMQRRSLEAQLQALQAQVEPQLLLDMLACARDRYEVDPAKGNALLAALIAYLRHALPKARESSPELGREVELARAYVNVMREQTADDIRFEADVPEAVRASCLPPMLLLPLIQRILARRSAESARPHTISVSATIAGDKLRVTIVHDGVAFAGRPEVGDLDDVPERLFALFGRNATLAFADEQSAVLETPLESTHGHPR